MLLAEPRKKPFLGAPVRRRRFPDASKDTREELRRDLLRQRREHFRSLDRSDGFSMRLGLGLGLSESGSVFSSAQQSDSSHLDEIFEDHLRRTLAADSELNSGPGPSRGSQHSRTTSRNRNRTRGRKPSRRHGHRRGGGGGGMSGGISTSSGLPGTGSVGGSSSAGIGVREAVSFSEMKSQFGDEDGGHFQLIEIGKGFQTHQHQHQQQTGTAATKKGTAGAFGSGGRSGSGNGSGGRGLVSAVRRASDRMEREMRISMQEQVSKPKKTKSFSWYHRKAYPSRRKDVVPASTTSSEIEAVSGPASAVSERNVIKMYSQANLNLGKTAGGVDQEADSSDAFVRGLFETERRRKRRRRAASASAVSMGLMSVGVGGDAVRLATGASAPDGNERQADPVRLQLDPTQLKKLNVLRPTVAHTTLNDFLIMVEACNRASRSRLECLCHYRIASIYEDRGAYRKSLQHFKKFLFICSNLKDPIGECLALNRLGVLYQLLGLRVDRKADPSRDPSEIAEKKMTYMQTALEYHLRQWEIADLANKVPAHLNMGLVFREMGPDKFRNAIDQFKLAFKYAMQVGDKHGQSIAVANLGSLQNESGDRDLAKACLEQHLVLSRSIRDVSAKRRAYEELGVLASRRGESDRALEMLERARELAREQNDQKKSNQLKCFLGIIRGNAQIEEKMGVIVSKISPRNKPTYEEDSEDESFD